jgi:Flp pilus assembly pilin Flp
MLLLFVRIHIWVIERSARWTARRVSVHPSGRNPSGRSDNRAERGQTTAEYALVILAAAAIAVVLIAWARSSGKLPAFFDKIIDDITNSAQ